MYAVYVSVFIRLRCNIYLVLKHYIRYLIILFDLINIILVPIVKIIN